MNNQKEVTLWSRGMLLIALVTILCWSIDNKFIDYIQLSLLEWWGIMMIFVAILAGYTVYNKEPDA